jgi:hypothetical protein
MKKLLMLLMLAISFSASAEYRLKFICGIDYTDSDGNYERIVKESKFDRINNFTNMPYATIPAFHTSDYMYSFYFRAQSSSIPNSQQIKVESKLVMSHVLEEFTFHGFNILKAEVEGASSQKRQKLKVKCETIPY